MNILGFPITKMPDYTRSESLSGKIKDYSKLQPEERAERIDEDLVSLSTQFDQLREAKVEAHSKAKAGLFTMIGGLVGTTALGIAGDMVPGPFGTALKVGSAAVTGVGIYSMFKNLNVRDFGTTEGLMETRTQMDVLRNWKSQGL